MCDAYSIMWGGWCLSARLSAVSEGECKGAGVTAEEEEQRILF